MTLSVYSGPNTTTTTTTTTRKRREFALRSVNQQITLRKTPQLFLTLGQEAWKAGFLLESARNLMAYQAKYFAGAFLAQHLGMAIDSDSVQSSLSAVIENLRTWCCFLLVELDRCLLDLDSAELSLARKLSIWRGRMKTLFTLSIHCLVLDSDSYL